MTQTQFPTVHTVLVRSKNPGNMGSAARATANISKQGKLILVAPRSTVNSQSKKMAAGAQTVLDERIECLDWNDFLQKFPSGIRIGLSRRTGKDRKAYTLPEAITRSMSNADNWAQDIFLIFGPEEDGLSSDDLDQCHMQAYLPAYGEFKSLNLAQAVILAHYICAQNLEKILFGKDSYAIGSLNNSFENNSFPEDIFKKFIQIALSEDNPLVIESSIITLRRMINRATPSGKETELLKLVLNKGLEKMLPKDN